MAEERSRSVPEIGVIFFCSAIYVPFGVQSSAASKPSSFQTWPSALLLKNHNVGQGSAWSLSWRELLICFFPRCSREIGGRRTRLWQRDTIIGIFGAETEDWGLEVWYTKPILEIYCHDRCQKQNLLAIF